MIMESQKFLNDDYEDLVAQALRAGLDLDCGSTYTNFIEPSAMRGQIRERDIDQALMNTYIVLLRLGYFDSVPAYDNLGPSDVCTKSSIELATDAARQSIVLLKNNNILPLSTKNISTIAVVGPHVNATDVMLGNYKGSSCQIVSPIEGLSSYAEVNYQMGCDVHCRNESLIWPVVKLAKAADATILVVGLNTDYEKEDLDRDNLELPGLQNQMISQISCISKGGRLPITWYESDYVWQLPMTSTRLCPIDKPGFPGRTYKFYNGSTIYPFDYGMSYTGFTYTVTSTQKLVEKKLAFNQHCLMINYNQSAYIPP